MIITKIEINNFRLYKGRNTLEFPSNRNRNVFLIAGNNGYGKTTLLTSLVWCLYGKLMIDVDDKYKRDVYESGGYKKFAEKLLNRTSILEATSLERENTKEKLYLKFGTSWEKNWSELQAEIDAALTFSVSMHISDIFIPTIPCNSITITRTYNVRQEEEMIDILIDGLPNELSKEVGPEIFIHDFIMPKEVAKFFFFDAEKIVSLAEMTSWEDKRSLNYAYTEVLGIKKYQDLKNNLEAVQIRFRKQSASKSDKDKLKQLSAEVEQSYKLISLFKKEIDEKNEDKAKLSKQSIKYQEDLIREGSSVSPEMVNDLKSLEDKLKAEYSAIKNKLTQLVDLAPFAIASSLLKKVQNQARIETEFSNHEVLIAAMKSKVSRLKKSIREEIIELKISDEKADKLVAAIHALLVEKLISGGEDGHNFSTILELSPENLKELDTIVRSLENTYAPTFKRLVGDYKLNRTSYKSVQSKLNNAFSKEADPLIKELRKKKETADKNIELVDNEILELRYKIESTTKDLSIKNKIIAELNKKVELESMDKYKDETAMRLVKQLDKFITDLKKQKKYSLEEKIKNELTVLMHKSSFIKDVKVIVGDDFMDVELYDSTMKIIDKDTLSKGEQQLYATALLKALVEESDIKFPVFIDSPLQKFDRVHSQNIIGKFYPRISEQVVLFPLLEKELTEKEFELLLPKMNKTWMIVNTGSDKSEFVEVEASKLFSSFQKSNEYVH